MQCLSIRQPWSWLICNGHKDIENRTWPTKFRGRIYVHAGKRFDEGAIEWLINKGFPAFKMRPLYSEVMPRGALVGEVDIVDCVQESASPWFVGPYGFVLANPIAYDTPIPCKGWLRFFDVP